VLFLEIERERHGDLRGGMARVPLDLGLHDVPGLAEILREPRRVGVAAERVEHAVLALEHPRGTGVAVARQGRGDEPALGRATEVQALHHPAGLREFHEAGAQRAANAEGVRHLLRADVEEPPDDDRSAEHSRDTRRVEPDLLDRVPGGVTDAVEHLEARNDRREQVLAVALAALRGREPRNAQCSARMDADARLAQRIELEGMRGRPVRETRERRADLDRRAENAAFAGGAVALRHLDDDLRPWHLRAERARPDRIDYEILGALEHFGRNAFILQVDGELGEGLRGALLSAYRFRCVHLVNLNSLRIFRYSS
jgi:hypothetical protein